MPSPLKKLVTGRRRSALTLGTAAAALAAGALPVAASASTSQIAIFQDGGATAAPSTTIPELRALGATTIRIFMPWSLIAPSPGASRQPRFNATDPGAYPADAWSSYDNAIRQAAADHMSVDLTVTGGAPVWAEGAGHPRKANIAFAWKPNAADFGQFVQAVGKRYSGSFTPNGAASALPRVRFWAIYNEPNFGQNLGPQMVNNTRTPYAPMAFRSVLNAGWNALQRTGHGRDTIVWGEFAAHGTSVTTPYNTRHQRLPGDYGQTKPLQFVRMVYCVTDGYKPLRGADARAIGCPTNAAGTRAFRAKNPALFKASGVSDHPYANTQSPVQDGKSDPNFATFPNLGRLATALDRATRVYGARPHFPIYNTEYGYITDPPNHTMRYPSPATAAAWLNWSEYLSYKNPRIKSYMQYLLQDPSPTKGPYSGFASGLETDKGVHKPSYDAYRLPVYMPVTSFSRSRRVEVWGAARPAPFAALDGYTPARVQIQLKRGASWSTIATARPGTGGYFDVRIGFPASGQVRLQWTYPLESLTPPGYPNGGTPQGLLPDADNGATIDSRSFAVKVH